MIVKEFCRNISQRTKCAKPFAFRCLFFLFVTALINVVRLTCLAEKRISSCSSNNNSVARHVDEHSCATHPNYRAPRGTVSQVVERLVGRVTENAPRLFVRCLCGSRAGGNDARLRATCNPQKTWSRIGTRVKCGLSIVCLFNLQG